MALKFAKAARHFDQYSRWPERNGASCGALNIDSLRRDVGNDIATPFDTAAAAVRDAAAWTDDEDWAHTLRRIAKSLDGAGRV